VRASVRPVSGSRFLSLIALAVALFALDGVISHAPASSERAELPMPGNNSDGDADGADLTLPPLVIAPPTLPNVAGPSLLEVERAPATSPFTDRIFRPPITALA
jgi:hypothetical protein